MRGCAERMTCPPLLTAFGTTPKFGGFPRAPTPSWRFATGRFEISSELHEGTRKRISVPKTSRGRPPTNEVLFGGQRRSEARSGGHVTRSAQPSTKLPFASLTTKPEGSQSGPPTAHPTPSLPPSRGFSRDSGGPRTSESEGRGGRGGRETSRESLASFILIDVWRDELDLDAVGVFEEDSVVVWPASVGVAIFVQNRDLTLAKPGGDVVDVFA